MSKKNEKEIEVTEEIVALEMTSKEASEFAEFKNKKAQEEYEALHGPDPESMYNVTLAFRHNINGKAFGPGVVQVPRKMLGKLQHHEQLQAANEIRLHQSATNFFKVSQGGQATRVKELPSV